jgi:hypothetical protein
MKVAAFLLLLSEASVARRGRAVFRHREGEEEAALEDWPHTPAKRIEMGCEETRDTKRTLIHHAAMFGGIGRIEGEGQGSEIS